jgi:hypothetical protein
MQELGGQVAGALCVVMVGIIALLSRKFVVAMWM